jgi:AcrR family transcriptional regulator
MKKPFSPEKKASVQEHILSCARDLFLSQGIAAVKMTDIAEASHLGVATLYRYFKVKKAIVIAVAISLWNEKRGEFAKISEQNEEQNLSGIESLKSLFDHFVSLFNDQKPFVLFVRDFDSFCLNERIKPEELRDYDAVFAQIESLFIACGEKGVKDHSIRADRDIPLIYSAYSRALMGLGEKLVGTGAIVPSDEKEDPRKMIEALVDVLIAYFAQ